MTNYVFNTLGERVSMWDGTAGQEVEGKAYWGGRLIEYYAAGGAYFEQQDWLGTERLRTGYNGGVEGAYWSLAFGDDFGLTAGVDYDPYHFAGMDADDESGTSQAQHRQYSPAAGRWMSPDPYSGSYDFSNPQSLNRYSYVDNNPVAFTDPSGQFLGLGGLGFGALCGPECAGIVAGAGAIFDLYELLSGAPSFHGSLKPRPTAPDDPAGLGESLGIPTSIPQGNWGFGLALGLPSEECDFGSCDGGPSYATQNGQPAIGNPYTSAYSGSLIVPIWFGFGPALTASYVPSLHLVCGGSGVGYSLGHSISAGPVMIDSEHAKDILGSWSFATGYNFNPFRGAQGSINKSGGIGGYSIGVPGASASVTYSWCHQF